MSVIVHRHRIKFDAFRSKGIPNLQRHQIGRALDYNNLDENGRPDVIYSWNRNIHDKDLATKTHYVKPVYEERVSSAEILRLSAKQHYTQAYKDGLEYIKAEKDYRAKERYLDSITPSRRNKTVTIGTSTSTSGLPVPDTEGRVYNYDAQTTAQTGLMFEAPANLHEVPDLPKNVSGQRVHPVIITHEKEIVVDNLTGAAQVKTGSSSVLKAPVVSNSLDYQEPMMPGSFPNMIGKDEVKIENNIPPEINIGNERAENKPEIALTTISDPNKVEELLSKTQVTSNLVRTPGKTPIGNVRKDRRFDPTKRRIKNRLEDSLLQSTLNKQELVGFSDGINIEVHDDGAARRRLSALAKDNTIPSPRPQARIGARTDELAINPAVKRKAEVSLRKEPSSKRRKIDDADEIQLIDPKVLERSRMHRIVQANVGVETIVDPVASRVKKQEKASFLRPIANLRGKERIDYAIPPTFTVADVEPTVSIRKRPTKTQQMPTRPVKKKKEPVDFKLDADSD
ncbi:uncharacterized protein EV422DRAFT_506769 [Fimicolochytrium jonesii]|uniref:uncharacterized protein n=1 Tax=Fimicolochytrium jonesii TaxID=1396493 RepID=UPI0022FF32A2|nr:uncharacterized protein EV422DRAFT_506769 [Fimicolochytrium jonesii]KAI8820533.1 hypothetical protein EV422DRAFT_506769 [Fimicolochytrium jonesii]